MYILKFIYHQGVRTVEYYGGGTYQFGGEKYAVLSSSNPKLFKSAKSAENSYHKLMKSCVNVPSEYVVEEVDDGLKTNN